MTNTRLTDPEVLELRYPVVLEDFHVRAGSGGRGRWNAGDGILRAIRFLEPMECTILSGHRRVRPFGLAGGESGELGAPRRWKDREATRLRCHHDRSRRHDHHQDPDGGQLWGAGEVSLSFEK
jgi:N-methylhydantoinase B/oxoprolinase/acetone carboxylase alpha subunit